MAARGPTRLSVIVAVAENGVVGRNNTLPWHLPQDLKYFKNRTLGKPIVMGRKTFESIGKPLPGRTNIVISGNPGYAFEGINVVSSMSEALDVAQASAAIAGQNEVVVIGGASVYAEALPLADFLYLTEIHAVIDGDAYMPPVDWSQWQEVSRERHIASAPDALSFSFVVYKRRK